MGILVQNCSCLAQDVAKIFDVSTNIKTFFIILFNHLIFAYTESYIEYLDDCSEFNMGISTYIHI